VYIYI
jgi:hypothetical protein